MSGETRAFIIILLIFIAGLCFAIAGHKYLEEIAEQDVITDVYDNSSRWTDEEWMDIYLREHGEG